MGKSFASISEEQAAFIRRQHLFFVATAPLEAAGTVNLSPKGMDCFRVLGPNRVAYLDLTGSGNETSAHLLQNGRITFMMCAFEGAPKILRLYGHGATILPPDAEWETLRVQFPEYAGVRQIIAAEIVRVQESCGFGVPRYEYCEDRDTLPRLWEQRGPEAVHAYHRERNGASVDGLPTPIRTLFDNN